MIDETHDAERVSWVGGAVGHPEFPLQNLPFGVFRPQGAEPRGGVAIGDMIFDLHRAQRQGLFSGVAAEAAAAAGEATLNRFLAMGPDARRALRTACFRLLADNAAERHAAGLLHVQAECTLQLPVSVGDYTDFYAGIHHATNVGRLFRPDNPLLPNYKFLPIAYHGRASSVRANGAAVRRPAGQRKLPDEAIPSFGPCRNLDYEIELGVWLGQGNAPGEPIPIGEAAAHVAGFCLLNDWSARDLQTWEYQPLGPFLAKSFVTTVSPWVVTPEALAPFRLPQAARPEGDPAPLPHLADPDDQAAGAFDVTIEATLQTAQSRAAGLAPFALASTNARHLYWTVSQMVAHHASNGCDLRPGDLLGTGTISGPEPSSLGSLLEATRGGREPLQLPWGETRRFLEDGDEVAFTGRCRRDGFATIGFGPCAGRVSGTSG